MSHALESALDRCSGYGYSTWRETVTSYHERQMLIYV